jgi:putative peptidoglycan lipid II flippase
MTAGTGVSRLTGFVRTAMLATVLGMTGTYLADSFNLANITPNIVYDLILGGVLSSLFIPVFIEYLHEHDEKEAWYVANAVFNIMLILLTTVSIALFIAAPYVIRAQTFLATNRGSMVADATFFLRFFIFEVVFYGFCAIYTGILNSYKHFTIPAFAPIANNIIVIATVAIYNFYPNKYLLAIGATLGVAAMAFIQLPWVRRTGFRYKWVFDLKHPAVRKLGRLAIPVVAYVLVNQIGLWVVNILAVKVQGGISAFQYGYIFFQLPYGIVAVSIITALFPTLSEQSVHHDKEKQISSISLGLRTTIFVVLPASVAYAVLAKPIVRLLLQHLHFGSADTQMLSSVVFFFVLGLVFFSIFMLILKVFYSMQDTKTPMIIAAVIVAINIAVDFIYFYSFHTDVSKVAGLALGNSTAYIVGAVAVWIVLWRRMGHLDGRRITISVMRTVAASAVMGVVCYFIALGIEKWLGVGSFLTQLLQVTLAIVIAAIVYLGIMMLFKSEELAAMRSVLARFRLGGDKVAEAEARREPTDEDSIME